MGAASKYFKNIYDSVTTIFEGMTVTFSYMFQKPVTIQYPNKMPEPLQKSLPDRYRGFLQVDYDLCTSCEACAKACPIDCISLDGVKVPGRKGKVPYFFHINLAKCMFCGLCVEPCPTDAIYFTKEFEGAWASVKNQVYSYVPEEVSLKFLEEAKKAEANKEKKVTEEAS